MAETPRYSHLAALLFLGGALLMLACVAVAAVAALRKAARFANLAAATAALTGFFYAALLVGVGLASPNKTLPPGNRKYFCEADCHIAYSVESVQEAWTLGPEAHPATARGRFVVVRLKTWFDQNSIASFRGYAPLTPNPRAVKLVDDRGRSALPVGGPALAAASTPLGQPLRPGQSYLTTFVFDVPADARNLKLLVFDTDSFSRLVMDHENSPLHGKIYLALSSSASSIP